MSSHIAGNAWRTSVLRRVAADTLAELGLQRTGYGPDDPAADLVPVDPGDTNDLGDMPIPVSPTSISIMP